jgi:hypothetical protein
MRTPQVLQDVGVAGKAPGETTKFVDQLVVDTSTVAGESPTVVSISNKSRVFPALTGETQLGIAEQIRADAGEALAKYGGRITVRRPGSALFDRPVTVSRVYLVYDARYADTELQRFIRNTLVNYRYKGQTVVVEFRSF